MSVVVCGIAMAVCMMCVLGMGVIGKLFSGRRSHREEES